MTLALRPNYVVDGVEVYSIFAGKAVVRLPDGWRTTIAFPTEVTVLKLVKAIPDGEGLITVWANPDGNDLVCWPDGRWVPVVSTSLVVDPEPKRWTFTQSNPPRTIDFTIRQGHCGGCGLCVATCPRHCLTHKEEHDARGFHPARLAVPEKCTACGECATMCPQAAFTIISRRAGG